MFLTDIGVSEYIDYLVKIQLFPSYFCYVKSNGDNKFLKEEWAFLLPYLISSILLILFVLLFEYFAKKRIFAKKVKQQKSAENNAQNARKKEVVVKTLNSTVGQAPKATEEASKAAAKAYTYENDKED